MSGVFCELGQWRVNHLTAFPLRARGLDRMISRVRARWHRAGGWISGGSSCHGCCFGWQNGCCFGWQNAVWICDFGILNPALHWRIIVGCGCAVFKSQITWVPYIRGHSIWGSQWRDSSHRRNRVITENWRHRYYGTVLGCRATRWYTEYSTKLSWHKFRIPLILY